MKPAASLVLLLAACVGTSGGARRGYGSAAGEPQRELAWMERVQRPAHVARPPRTQELAIADALRDLGSEDFGSYSAAARRLVEIGEPAIGYLGYTGESGETSGRVQRHIPVVLRSILGQLEAGVVGVYLRSPYAVVRAAAAEVAGQRRLMEYADALVEQLMDEDLEVRHAAVVALRRLSKRFFGYRPDATEEERARAIDRWKRLWS